MKKIILLIAILSILGLMLGCAKEVTTESTQIANPASEYCEMNNGQLEIVTAADGSQSGVCVLDAGVRCEEWAYYRGECPEEEALIAPVETEPQSEFASELEKDLPNTIQNEICQKLPLTKQLSPGDRHYCLAVVNQNPAFCEMIEADNEQDLDAIKEKNLCLAHATPDVSYCKKMTDNEAKKDCYFRLSLLSEDINICDNINYDPDEKQLCYFSFVNTLYWEDKSDRITLAHCNKLPEPDRSTCLAYKDRDVSLCKNNVNCLTYFEQPLSFCSGLGKALESCIRDRAMVNKDLALCQTLTGEKKDDCIGDFAGHIGQDYLTCDLLSNDFLRQTCYQDVAVQSSWLQG